MPGDTKASAPPTILVVDDDPAFLHSLELILRVDGFAVTTAENGKGPVGRLVTKYHLHQWVTKNAPKLVTYGRDLATPALSLGAGAVSGMYSKRVSSARRPG